MDSSCLSNDFSASDLGSNIVIGNKTADAKILLDVQASCQTDVTEDDARAGLWLIQRIS